MLERVVIGGGRALLLDGRDTRVHCIAMLGEWHGGGRKCGNNVGSGYCLCDSVYCTLVPSTYDLNPWEFGGYMQECPRAI
jgi:hypothetical protein